MGRTIVIYALALAAGAFALEWIQFQYLARAFTTEIYIVLIAVGFAALGVWVGHHLTRREKPGPFETNLAALKSLRITDRERAVLDLLAAGQSNKEIAASLGVSPNTVKSHVASLFDKLEVQRRTQAIRKAKQLSLIP
jgi:DNA-binding NarL/FixJ family response regulator